MKTKLFEESPRVLDTNINNWLKENPDIVVIDIKFSAIISHSGMHYSQALIMYTDYPLQV